MEKIVNKLINDAVVGADRYANNGSTWLIFTETKQWVIELTEEKTLWYNYNFFKNLFSYLSFDVVENQHYITKWVEDTIINGVKGTNVKAQPRKLLVEDTIQNGVKHTPNISLQLVKGYGVANQVENTIKNGVKETKGINGVHGMNVAIQNGVKKTDFNMYRDNNAVEDTIQNGVKETKRPLLPRTKRVEDAIEYGVKKTYSTLRRTKLGVDDIIRNGVKDTKPMDEWVNAESIVEGVMEYGVKELQPLPAQDGNMDWGNYYRGKEDRTKPFNEYLDEAIRFGVKEVIEENHHRTREVVVTIKDGVKETHQDCSNNIARVEGIIRVGEKLD
jgi:hypothetical protein